MCFRTKHALIVFVLIALAFSAAVYAQEHLVSLELTFSDVAGTTCPVASPVVIAAVDCDAATLANEIEDGLVNAGLDAGPLTPFCRLTTSGNFADWFQCIWNVPNGCEQAQERATVQLGQTCGNTRLAGMVIEPSSSFATFLFRVFP